MTSASCFPIQNNNLCIRKSSTAFLCKTQNRFQAGSFVDGSRPRLCWTEHYFRTVRSSQRSGNVSRWKSLSSSTDVTGVAGALCKSLVECFTAPLFHDCTLSDFQTHSSILWHYRLCLNGNCAESDCKDQIELLVVQQATVTHSHHLRTCSRSSRRRKFVC